MSWLPAIKLNGKSMIRNERISNMWIWDINVCIYFREKKREREREELWKRLHELADELSKSDKTNPQLAATLSNQQQSSSAVGGASDAGTNSIHGTTTTPSTTTNNNTPSSINSQLNSMSISAGGAAVGKWCNNTNGKNNKNKIECCWFC